MLGRGLRSGNCAVNAAQLNDFAMTAHEIELAQALGKIAGWTGARFCTDIAHAANTSPDAELTLRQRHYMEIMAWRYRRQLPKHLVPDSKPLNLPGKRKEPKMKKLKMPDLFEQSHQ
jgi:hypothetical protein